MTEYKAWKEADAENARRIEKAKGTTRTTFVKLVIDTVHACIVCGGRIRMRNQMDRGVPKYQCDCPDRVWRTNFSSSVTEPFEEVPTDGQPIMVERRVD